MTTALITGITGQTGSYLAELLLRKGYSVHGIVRRASNFNTQRIDHLLPPHEAKLALHHGDMLDPVSLRRVIDKVQPDEIYNLAAQSHVRVSFDQPAYTAEVIAIGTVNLLEAIEDCRDVGYAKYPTTRKIRFYQASSSEMFGNSPAPQDENTPFRPQSPYACAKVHAFWATVNHREGCGLFACNGILFNHESPRRGETFVTRKITRAATRIKLGLQEKLILGNLDARRDWGYAGDYVHAIWRMLQQDEPDDYVIATGESYSIRQFLDIAFNHLGLNWQKHVHTDQRFYRPMDIDELRGSPVKAAEKLNWKPWIKLPTLCRTMVDADLKLAEQERLLLDAGHGSDEASSRPDVKADL